MIRDTLRALSDDAARCGIAESARFGEMTFREVHLLLEAHSAARRGRLVFARLIALAVHQPERLPVPPLPDMPPDEMKRRLTARSQEVP